MPRIWAETIDTHRRQVHDAILEATAELIAEHGPMSIAMSAIAERAGIGRATLYKYFPDVESILLAWHARDFGDQHARLRALVDAETTTLGDVAEFVCAQRQEHAHHRGAGLVDKLAHTLAGAHRDMGHAIEREILDALTQLLSRLGERGEVRRDREPEFLARWLLHAAHAPADLDDASVTGMLLDALTPRDRGGARRPRR